MTLQSVADSGGGTNTTVLTIPSTVTVISVNNVPVIGQLSGDVLAFGSGLTVLDRTPISRPSLTPTRSTPEAAI